MNRLAIVGASGKLGFATLSALLDRQLIPADHIVCTTSSDTGAKKLEQARQRGVEIRKAEWDNSQSLEDAFKGCQSVFLISSARVERDYNDAAHGLGREADHFRAIEAARRAGVQHVYYSSLAFANPSLSRVMKAHERTEEYLRRGGLSYTLIREGLYSESWPLYLGHYNFPDDNRAEIVVAGDGRISWTSIPDLGLANALIIADPVADWAHKALYLSQSRKHSLEETASIVSKVAGRELRLKVVDRPDHEHYYIEDRKMDGPFIKWWSKTYDALKEDECNVTDPTLETLLSRTGAQPTSFEDTVRRMYAGEE